MDAVSHRKIEVLGPGCTRCKETFRVVAHVVETEKLPFDVEKNESMERMIELGLLATPGIAVDGKILFSGRIPKAEELRAALAAL
ncbi:MAG TPA: MTH895/ArsE family thioredoxin-like protein [Thermoanaerobaculia bacterium]|nr:MTH895/ArsE family thioredoxin-like protein [Thermoanaerobaculia bacterium]